MDIEKKILKALLIMSLIGLDNGSVSDRQQAIILTQWWPSS